MQLDKQKIRKGLLFGILVGIAWGLDGTLMSKIGMHPILQDQTYALAQGVSGISFSFSPLVTAFFHESFCFLWVALVLLMGKQLKHVFYLLFKTKKGRAAAIAALVGSPIGMSAYLLGIKYASAPYASSISVVYPGIGAMLSYFILKEKLSVRAVVGIAISLTGSVMLGLKPGSNVPDTFLMGIVFTVIAVLGWAMEGVMICFAMKRIKDEDHIEAAPQQLLCLRYFVSMVFYAIVVLPVIKGYPLAGQLVSHGLWYQYAGVAILGAITYLAWYKAVDLIGSAMGTALNSTAALWTIIFSAVILGNPLTPNLVFWGAVTVLGVFIFAIDPTDMIANLKCKHLKTH